MNAPISSGAQEGLRSRKRRETRQRITSAALALFLEKGFEATTVDEIAAAVDISKRSFFDYFPSKDEVIAAWQDEFGQALGDAVAARPAGEPMTRTVEVALTSTIIAHVTPRSMAIARLIRDTPALRAREQVKYVRLEQRLCEALAARCREGEKLKARILAMAAIGGMRVAGEIWNETGRAQPLETFARDVLRRVWTELAELGREGAEACARSPAGNA